MTERALRNEGKQLLSFEDSFKAHPNKSQEMSSKRSLLSVNLGSSSSRSVKAVSPRENNETLFVKNVFLNIYYFFLNSLLMD